MESNTIVKGWVGWPWRCLPLPRYLIPLLVRVGMVGRDALPLVGYSIDNGQRQLLLVTTTISFMRQGKVCAESVVARVEVD